MGTEPDQTDADVTPESHEPSTVTANSHESDIVTPESHEPSIVTANSHESDVVTPESHELSTVTESHGVLRPDLTLVGQCFVPEGAVISDTSDLRPGGEFLSYVKDYPKIAVYWRYAQVGALHSEDHSWPYPATVIYGDDAKGGHKKWSELIKIIRSRNQWPRRVDPFFRCLHYHKVKDVANEERRLCPNCREHRQKQNRERQRFRRARLRLGIKTPQEYWDFIESHHFMSLEMRYLNGYGPFSEEERTRYHLGPETEQEREFWGTHTEEERNTRRREVDKDRQQRHRQKVKSKVQLDDEANFKRMVDTLLPPAEAPEVTPNEEDNEKPDKAA